MNVLAETVVESQRGTLAIVAGLGIAAIALWGWYRFKKRGSSD